MQPASKLLYWLIALPIGLILIVFSISNRDGVLVSFSPLPFEMSIPLFLLVFAIFVIGVGVGGLLGWMAGHGTRRRARERRRRVNELETSLKDAEERLKKADGPALPAPSSGQKSAPVDQLPAA
ncbi:MAG: lipopolysaccharide assembly protein LapA domain-containing protein [Pseudomonadota bacterium]